MTKTAYSSAIGRWIRDERTELAMSQAELGEVMNVSESTISRWETGSRALEAYSHALLKAYFREQKRKVAV